MGRKITIIFEDENTNTKISGTTILQDMNDLYINHGINGLTQVAITLNAELNKMLSEDVKITLPDDINILPPGKQW